MAEPSLEMPNGIRSWVETHHEIVGLIATSLRKRYKTACYRLVESQGRTALYDHAILLTNHFELINEGKQWDGEFTEEVEKFFNERDQ